MLQSILIVSLISILWANSLYAGEPEDNALPANVNKALHDNPYMSEKETERLKKMAERARQTSANMMSNLREKADNPLVHATGIANLPMAEEREKILNSLGLSYEDPNIYIFVSFSMPLELIRAYAREAMWSGAILVFRGIGEEDTLKTFVHEKMFQIIGKKGASATIQIDPRLYDAFQITSVPTIVYTELDSLDMCSRSFLTSAKLEDKSLDYHACGTIAEKDYWKLSGTVTLDWALEQFAEAGAEGAIKHLNVLRENLKTGGQKDQQAFDGDWDEIPTPQLKNEIMQSLQELGQVYETPYGLSVGPPGLGDSQFNLYRQNAGQ